MYDFKKHYLTVLSASLCFSKLFGGLPNCPCALALPLLTKITPFLFFILLISSLFTYKEHTQTSSGLLSHKSFLSFFLYNVI